MPLYKFLIFLVICVSQTRNLQLHKAYANSLVSLESHSLVAVNTSTNDSGLMTQVHSFFHGVTVSFSRFKTLLSSNLITRNQGNMTAGFRFFWLLILACVTILILCLLLNWLLVFTKLSRLELNQIEREEKMLNSADN